MKDATHVAATATHFSTNVPGVRSKGVPTDAGTDATPDGGTCYANCLSSASSMPDAAPTTSCTCEATCDGHTYKMSCTGSSCACLREGSQTDTPSGQCGTTQQNLSIYNDGCRFPGELAPPLQCSVVCGAASSPGDGGTSSCSCSTNTCQGHAYAVSCTNDTCDCKTDGNSTKSGTSTNACPKAIDTYKTFCGYPGDAGPSSGEGGSAPTVSEGGVDASS